MKLVNLAGAVVVSIALLYVAFFGAGPLPALGPAFNPETGAWTMGADAASYGTQTLHLDGLQKPAKVVLEANGTAHITAATDHDLFLATGYVHAKFRLFQMDLERRQGEGLLSEVFGKDALNVDRFELQFGLLRTAQQEWALLSPSDPVRVGLLAYAQGVNDRIAEAERTHQLPAVFTFSGYQPKPWTPIDTLIIKGDLEQMESFSDTPLVMALLNRTLGPDLTSEWFPILPPNQQAPYEPGPYPPAEIPAPVGSAQTVSQGAAIAAADIYQRLSALPAGLVAHGGASNNWAVSGAHTTSGGPLMAGDPHLHLTLPAIWFQLTLDSPGFHSSGVSVPGTPIVLIGHNQHISWSLTDAQNQQTFFYVEHEDSAHPGEYLWNGTWTKYRTIDYEIPVLGQAPNHLTVKISVHGPVINERGQATSVWFTGNIPSHDIGALMQLNQAANWQDFRNDLSQWHGSAHNFVYADDQGNIGMISAGYYPQVAPGCEPWLPMPGTGEDDVTGTIPYDQIPQVYNPPDGIVWSANQRQVTADYPYYIGSATFFDPGYRANEIHRFLSDKLVGGGKLSVADMMALQTDTRDYLAGEMVPFLIRALAGQTLTGNDKTAFDLLSNWDYRMDKDSTAASMWWVFWQSYLAATFDPWWRTHNVKVDQSELNDSLGQDLEAWTSRDQTNAAFTLIGSAQNADDVMRAAFHTAVISLTTRLGGDPSRWTWGRIHKRELESLALISGLSYGPLPDRGDAYTPLAAPEFPSTHGPSWRMVVDWGAQSFRGIYPGGQSENPASSWYSDRAAAWWDGKYYPMLDAVAAEGTAGAVTWSLES